MISRRTVLAVAVGAVVAAGSAFLPAGALTAAAAERVRFDRAAFDSALQAGGPVLIDISASWCSTCARQRAVLAELTARPAYAGFTIFVVDYDTEKDIMRAFGATQRSTLIAFKGGQETGRIVGDTRPDAIEALLASAV
jgi:thioredoxin-like negative regulator of GroEL